MKNFFVGVSILNFLALAGFLFFSFSNKPRVAFVNSSQLLNEYVGMQQARISYQKKLSLWKANVDTLGIELQTQVTQFEREKSKLTVKEKELFDKLIETKKDQLIQYQQAVNTQAQQEDAKMTSDVLSQVNVFLKKYGEDNGYEIIFAATDYGNIVYAQDNLDITQDVLVLLNKQLSAK
jgi:outer membrane protein